MTRLITDKAVTAAWGRNEGLEFLPDQTFRAATHALLAEGVVSLYDRHAFGLKGASVSMGVSVSGAIVPRSMAPRYGGRISAGLGVFLVLSPPRHAH